MSCDCWPKNAADLEGPRKPYWYAVQIQRTGASLSWVPMSEVGPDRARRWYEGLRERRASSVKHPKAPFRPAYRLDLSVNPAGMVGPVQSSE